MGVAFALVTCFAKTELLIVGGCSEKKKLAAFFFI